VPVQIQQRIPPSRETTTERRRRITRLPAVPSCSEREVEVSRLPKHLVRERPQEHVAATAVTPTRHRRRSPFCPSTHGHSMPRPDGIAVAASSSSRRSIPFGAGTCATAHHASAAYMKPAHPCAIPKYSMSPAPRVSSCRAEARSRASHECRTREARLPAIPHSSAMRRAESLTRSTCSRARA
jgi:hypothetical protein